jgi:hypothetical protein
MPIQLDDVIAAFTFFHIEEDLYDQPNPSKAIHKAMRVWNKVHHTDRGGDPEMAAQAGHHTSVLKEWLSDKLIGGTGFNGGGGYGSGHVSNQHAEYKQMQDNWRAAHGGEEMPKYRVRSEWLTEKGHWTKADAAKWDEYWESGYMPRNTGYTAPDGGYYPGFNTQWAGIMLQDYLLSIIDGNSLTNPGVIYFISMVLNKVKAGDYLGYMGVLAGLAAMRNYKKITLENLYSLIDTDKWSVWDMFGDTSEEKDAFKTYAASQALTRRRRQTKKRRQRRGTTRR